MKNKRLIEKTKLSIYDLRCSQKQNTKKTMRTPQEISEFTRVNEGDKKKILKIVEPRGQVTFDPLVGKFH